MSDYQYITHESFDDNSIVRLKMNRPEVRNAQNIGMLFELNDAFLKAEADDDVKVVIFGGHGRSFSAGHDLGTPVARAETHFRSKKLGAEGRMLFEWEYFLSYTQRWRNLRKITIAQVQGHCLAGGIMICWSCDLITAGQDAVFADMIGARLGMCGAEYFAHPWEFGARKAKELLLTGDSVSADEAHRLGMVSKVFPNESLEEDTLNFARRIAQRPSVTSLLIKESVNQTMDIQGFYNSLRACFTLHQINHAHWSEVTNGGSIIGTPELGVPAEWGAIKHAEKTTPGG